METPLSGVYVMVNTSIAIPIEHMHMLKDAVRVDHKWENSKYVVYIYDDQSYDVKIISAEEMQVARAVAKLEA